MSILPTWSQNVQSLFDFDLICQINRVKHILDNSTLIVIINLSLICCNIKILLSVMAYKCLKGLAPPYLARRFTSRSQTHGRATRQMDELDIPFYRTAAGQRSFLYRATKLWNDLDNNIKDSSSIGVFKNLVREILHKECWNNSK